MDLNHLGVFVAVAETLGISAAARRLRVPKSSVSRALARLEADLGVVLLRRTTRHVSLTTAGSAVYERSAPLLRSLGASLAEVSAEDVRPSGLLRVTSTVDFGATVLADVVAQFQLRYPEVEIDVHLSNAVVDLVKGGFDAALRMSPRGMKDSSLVARKVGPLTLQLFASPHYLARRGAPRTPGDLSEHDWIAYRGFGALRLYGPGNPQRLLPRGQIKCDDMLFARASVRAGAGIGVLPVFLADPDVVAGDLVRVLPRWDVPRGNVWLVYPASQSPSRKLLAFRDFVLEALRARGFG
jgi:DNA-binding transcriptional LysR family regulator